MSGEHISDMSDASGTLWLDVARRDWSEEIELEQNEPQTRRITGNLVIPGFTAPKLLWVAKHEPDLFRKVAKVLLPTQGSHRRLRILPPEIESRPYEEETASC